MALDDRQLDPQPTERFEQLAAHALGLLSRLIDERLAPLAFADDEPPLHTVGIGSKDPRCAAIHGLVIVARRPRGEQAKNAPFPSVFQGLAHEVCSVCLGPMPVNQE